MDISSLTKPQIDFYAEMCNFTPDERELFILRAHDTPLELCTDELHCDISTVKRISQKVSKKIRYVNDHVNIDRWMKDAYG